MGDTNPSDDEATCFVIESISTSHDTIDDESRVAQLVLELLQPGYPWGFVADEDDMLTKGWRNMILGMH